MNLRGVALTSVRPQSPAARAGLRQGDRLLAIDGQPLKDALDVLAAMGEEQFDVEFARARRAYATVITRRLGQDWGAQVEPPAVRHCGNRCLFCFVDQMPKGFRSTLYIKDEDYRYSFLYGSFCTLSNITRREMDRIVAQNLSPLYISVHAVDSNVRLQLLGLKKDDHFMEKLAFLADNGIQFHTQIVLCPEINDGKVLIETIESLYQLYPGVLSVVVVPLGKTKFREGLAPLRSVNKRDAEKTLSVVNRLQKKYLKRAGTRFVFAADEFYLMSNTPFPKNSEYEEYQQYENGVGMARYFLQAFNTAKKSFPAKISRPCSVLIVTGKSFYPVIRRNVLPALNRIQNVNAQAIAVHNHLLGDEITVAGLLCGKDTIRAAWRSTIACSGPNCGSSADCISSPPPSAARRPPPTARSI